MPESTRRFIGIIPAIAGLSVLLAPAVQASDIEFLDLFGNQSYEQTGNGNTLSLNGDFFSAELVTTVANPYTSVSLIYPGPGTPQNLPQMSPTDYSFQTGFLPSLAAMEAAYPMGNYKFLGMGTADTGTLTYSADDYAASAPYLTGTDYSSLQGMNTALPFTFTFNSYTPGATATDGSYIFLTIFDVTTDTQAYTAGFLSPSTTSVVLPGGILTPGDLYSYELDYSNRDGVASAGTEDGAFIGFDMRTDGTFTTAAVATPEPRTDAALVAAAFACILILRRRRQISA